MKAREYTKRIQIYTVTPAYDGFGGYTTGTPTLSSTRWAKVENISQATASQLRLDYGLNDQQILLRFTLRDFTFSKKDTYLTYDGSNYLPLVVQERDQYGVDLVIIAVRQ